jgi:hypothetical protein
VYEHDRTKPGGQNHNKSGVIMPRMKRKDVLTAIRTAGYHGDKERAVLLYVKNWVSLTVYGREFDIGAAMRQNGIPCDCSECRKDETGAG